ncbi:glutamate carboxypeptidase [Faunimonas pinastri]|uniref:Glutamate carboxypeptidase n=1 Tax=Faunimonas pinastri TaxID=1855383 RepID=A0A1H9NCG1_9HYPH|nr:hypothetical protein [Faunimonas pinastri]SER33501.1 glutamate carboxypeptidase [Faunimonas pinastri]
MADLVNQDSGSYDKAGVDRTGEILQAFLGEHGIDCERVPVSEYGDAFRATVPGRTEGRPIVLIGHRDTVFPSVRPPVAPSASRPCARSVRAWRT